MKIGLAAGAALFAIGCDPYGYSRYDDKDPKFQDFIGYHKTCLQKLQAEMQIRPRDKRDWSSARYHNSVTGEESYDIAFNNVDGSGDSVICSIDAITLDKVTLRRISAVKPAPDPQGSAK